MHTATGSAGVGAGTLRIGLVARWCGETEAARHTEGEGAPMSEEPGRDGLGGPDEIPRPPSDNGAATQPGETTPTAAPAPWASPSGSPEPAARTSAGSQPAAPPARWQPAAARPADQPGQSAAATPLRPFSVGEILGAAAGIFRRNPRTILPLAALLVTLQQVLTLVAQLATREIPTRIDVASGTAELSLGGGFGLLLGLIANTVVGAILTAMIVVLVADDLLGQRLGLAELWRRVRPRLAALIGLALMAGVLSVLGLFLLVVPGVLLWSAWSLAIPALLLERLGPIRALRRSWRLAWPDLGRVFLVRLVAFLLGTLMLYVIAAPFLIAGALIATAGSEPIDSQAPLTAVVFAAVGSIVGGLIAKPFGAAVLVLLYLDRRMRAEGMDIVLHLQQRQRRRAAPPVDGRAGHGDLPALSATGAGPWAGPAVPVSGPPAAGAP